MEVHRVSPRKEGDPTYKLYTEELLGAYYNRVYEPDISFVAWARRKLAYEASLKPKPTPKKKDVRELVAELKDDLLAILGRS